MLNLTLQILQLSFKMFYIAGIPAFQFTGGVRLVGGPYRSEGRLQLYFFNVWGGVCGQNFSTLEANAVCKRLGYKHSRGIRAVSRYIHTVHIILWYVCTAFVTQ